MLKLYCDEVETLISCENNNPNEAIIRQEILSLLSAKFAVSSTMIDLTNDSTLKETAIPINPYDMVYLICFLEDKYGFKYTETNFDDPRIYTMNGLARITAQNINYF